MPKESPAYKAGVAAAQNGNHIDNCYPYHRGQQYIDWTEGYNSIKPDAKRTEELYDLAKSFGIVD